MMLIRALTLLLLGWMILAGSGALAQTASATALASSNNPVAVGAMTTLTATVTPSTATGTITFKDGSSTLGRVVLSGGVAVFGRSFTTAGRHNLTAVYSGNASYGVSTSSVLAQTVTAAPTAISLNSSINPVPVDQTTILTARVTPAAATGVVTFKDGTTILGTVTMVAGAANLGRNFTSAGERSLSAVYRGTTHYQTSTSPVLTQNVVSAPVALPSPPTSPLPVVNYEYDAQGNPTNTIQAPGVAGFNFATQSSYDRLERPTTITDAKSGVTQLGYDGLDRSTSVTDPRNLVTLSPRNGLGDATSLSSPDTGTATMTHDVVGNLTTRLDSRGVLATHTYDPLNRLTKIAYSRSGQTTQNQIWTYDQVGTGYSNGVGRLTSTSHPGGSTQYTYDPQGRLLTAIQRVSAATGANTLQITRTTSYGYDGAGNITRVTYPSGRVLTVSYNGGKPTAIQLAKDGASTPADLLVQIQHSPFGGPIGWQWPYNSGAQAASRVQDAAGRLVRYPLGRFVRDVTYDAADRITGYAHYEVATGSATAAAMALNQSFGYDELGRLTSASTATASQNIGYDAGGNRTYSSVNGVLRNHSLDSASNRLLAVTNPPLSYSFDATGNVTGLGNAVADYNLTGRWASMVSDGVTTTFTHNTQGQRVRKYSSSGAASTTLFVYDQSGQLLGEYSSTGAAIREYVWLGDIPVALFSPDPIAANPPVTYFIDTDHLNTPRAVTDRNNAVRWSWMAEPFGSDAPDTNPQGLEALNLPLRFPGQYADVESGLFYNYHRDYDPWAGRYSQSDPIGLAGGLNTFSYVEGNPVSFTDPEGLQAEHTKNPRPSTEQKHQEGDARRGRDAGGEKGDRARDFPRKTPPNHKGPWPPKVPFIPGFLPLICPLCEVLMPQPVPEACMS